MFTNLHITTKIKNMESQNVPIKKFALNNGLLLGLLSVVLGVLAYVLDMHLERNWIISLLSLALTTGVIVYAFKQYKAANGGFMSLGQALKLGLAIALIAGLIGVIYNYVLMNFIEPDMINQIMDKQQEAMLEQNPNMTQSQIDQANEMTAKFMTPGMMAAFGIIGSLFFGFIISLIAGLVMKKNNPAGS